MKKIHFIGIGGIGMSGAANLALARGLLISGSDMVESDMTRMLASKGASIFIGTQSAEHVPADAELVVHSNAIMQSNPEFRTAQERKINTQTYYQFVGELMSDKSQLVVTGMHGKSTTTAMLAQVMIATQQHPSVLIGTKVPFLADVNSQSDEGKYFIVEGDEYMKGFLGYQPFGVIINNIEEEHMDVYKDLDDIVETFRAMVKKIPANGVLVYNGMDENVARVVDAAATHVRKISFGLDDRCDITGKNIMMHDGAMGCVVHERGTQLGYITLHVPGIHNLTNALGVVALCRALGLTFDQIAAGLEQFHGTWRRLELIGEAGEMIFYDDYGHHPTEIKATVQALRQLYPQRKIKLVLQLHQYERVKSLYAKFVTALKEIQSIVDDVILTDFYFVEGRDDASLRATINAQQLSRDCEIEGGSIAYVPKDDLLYYMKGKLQPHDVVLTEGAGDITTIGRELLKQYK